MTPKAIVTDIEGATTSLGFVHEVLFPYARARLARFVELHPQAVEPILAEVRTEAGDQAMSRQACVARLLEWHDADRKIGPLKTLQGLIWAEGYASGALQGHVYDDAVEGLRRWRARGIPLYVYSSGSVAAQKLLFGHTGHGDLTPLFRGYFDTAIGGKREARSYRVIAERIGAPPPDILFLSDMAAELRAAAEAGLAVTLVAREDGATSTDFPIAVSFDDILPA